MKSYTLPQVPLELVILPEVDSNQIRNLSLYTNLSKHKSKIDEVRTKWDSAKKVSNEYEYIYTSSNSRKNISQLIPVSRSFFKLREIIYDYRLNVGGTCACIAEAPGGFVQSILHHTSERKIELNTIHGITLVSDDKDIPYWNPQLIQNPLLNVCVGSDKTGDLYKLNNVLSFIKQCKKHSCQFVTADGGFDYTQDFEQELASYPLIYSEIMIALNVQAKGGTFVCKLFDLFYDSTIDLLYLLYLSYETITFCKPYTSRQSNSEKYILCRGFKGYNVIISNLLCSSFGHSKLPIQIPDEFITMINHYQMLFVKNQCMRINGTLDLISQRRIMDKPSKHQLKLAKDWCKNYNIPINRYHIYR